MTLPLVTVVVAVRNGERFLADAIRSVLAQDYRPIEIVVVDGHSTDRTAAIARSFPEVRVVDQRGTGIADGYNTGIAEARGELVAFLSHDDVWTPDKLSVQVAALVERPDALFATAHATFFLEPGFDIPAGFRPELLEGEHPAHVMETLLARRAAFDVVGLFDTKLTLSEDVDWFARAIDARVPSVTVPRALLRKRVHGENSTLTLERSNRSLLEAVRRSIARKRRDDEEAAS